MVRRPCGSASIRGGMADEQALDLVLDGVLFDIAPVVLDAGPQWSDAARALRAIWRREGVDPGAVRGSFGADPFGDWADDRDAARLDAGVDALSNEARALCAEHPNVRVATIDGTRFHDAGASDAQELGDTLAVVVATLRVLTEAGLDVGAALAQLEIRLAATVEQFATIAKFRAARRLLARVAEVCSQPTAATDVPLHAVTSRAMTTRYEPAVNIVRATVACFAAAAGGADAVTVLPHDSAARRWPTDRARRLARNTQTVLELESNVARVIDPAGGSWYVERLTDELAERAWDVFQEIEAAGGFRAAVEAGIVDDRIAATRSARTADVDHRRAPIIGVSEFPSVGRRCARRRRRGVGAGASLGSRVRATSDARRRRRAATGTRPAVFLARLGPAAATAQPITAAANFFGIAGLVAPHGPATEDVDEITEAFRRSETSVACICAAPDADEAARDKLRDALGAAGATRVYSASELEGDARAELAALLDHLAVR